MSKVFGTATVTVDGEELLINRDATLNLGGVRRNTVSGNTVHGFAEEAVPASVEIQLTIQPGTSLKRWAEIADATVVFEADTGQQWILANAWVEEPPEATGGEGGRVPLKFVARESEEVR